jgi:hypothetical protein
MPNGTGTNGLSIDVRTNTIGFTFSSVNTAVAPKTTAVISLDQLTTIADKENLSALEWTKLLPTGIPLIIAEDSTAITPGIHHIATDSLNGATNILSIENK